MKIFVVSFYDPIDNDTTIAVFDNREAAVKYYDYFIKKKRI